jgi:hypothetical protein
VEPGSAPDLRQVPQRFLALFDNMDFWMDQSARCLSCGVCTYLCPACSCFNITDENSGLKGKRLRTWDTCMSALYTLEGSGHNPRVSRAHRLRNRVGHKFCYHRRNSPAQATASPRSRARAAAGASSPARSPWTSAASCSTFWKKGKTSEPEPLHAANRHHHRNV